MGDIMPRLKRIEVEAEEKDIYDDLQEILHSTCAIQGCRPKFHLEEARDIIEALKNRGYNVKPYSQSEV